MNMKYYIIEHQKRPDGEINVSETARSSYASALSYYHERCSKMLMTDLYILVSLMLVDEDLNVLEKDLIATQYVPPVEESNDVEESETVSE